MKMIKSKKAYPEIEMTIEEAQEVKRLRCIKKDGYSWRAIGEHFLHDSTQWIGMSICMSAMKKLGEDVDNGWN